MKEGKTAKCYEILAAMLDNETDPRAFANIARCCDGKCDVIRSSLIRFLKEKESCYLGKAAALTMLGGQRNEQDVDYLMNVCQQKEIGQHGIIRSGALTGLGESRNVKAFKYKKLI